MSENTTFGIAVLSRADIPKGWRAMSEYVSEGQATYTAVKKAA